MHEALFDDRFLKNTGVSTLDFAKALIDEGFHPATVYFPLVVHGAMLVEPTETGEQAIARSIHSGDTPASRRGIPATPSFFAVAPGLPRAVVSMRRVPRATLCCAGVRRRSGGETGGDRTCCRVGVCGGGEAR